MRTTETKSQPIDGQAAVLSDPAGATCGRARRPGRFRSAAVAFAVSVLVIICGQAPAGAERAPAVRFDGLVDVGGYRLYLRCTGHGSPTVVFDSALGATRDSWRLVEPAIAEITRTCVYDRAGVGLSDPGPVPRTSQLMVDELRTLLRRAGIRGPKVLVGHSLGGLNMQLFARQDGGRTVKGVVLVDATPPELHERFAQVLTPEQLDMALPPPDQNPEGFDLQASSEEVLTPAVPGRSR